ncbi:erythroblast NAD(P)(+)--arginine ADP-ribosyltransferase-like [Hirundo rustica]|uniref:erythroblast NAD(P)(+)--arginine ADP-ribosyltransferase-like n=1 Tax=Hirundo rustica TaxID=43150 RepID=UPI001A94FDD7|nr:erythroblast NAD(P)(+)--arginine ADP-ribosyltransferase-like [Hirundo rustica]
MAPLTRTLALLATSVATVAMDVKWMDMAPNAFDDQYLGCGPAMTVALPALNRSEFKENLVFAEAWHEAVEDWKDQGSQVRSLLSLDQAIALRAYTMEGMRLYQQFNMAVREAGSSSSEYRDNFRFKSLHFLLTQALQKLRRPNQCYDVHRGVKDTQFKANKNDKVRFGHFASSSVDIKVALGFGHDTLFKVNTCHGVHIQEFSSFAGEKEVLIPPFETFKVTDVRKIGNTMVIDLQSTGNASNYNCEWLKGGSLPRNSPHLGGLLLGTVAMAVVTGTI